MQRTYQLSEMPSTRAEGALAALLAREGRRYRFADGAVIQQQGDIGAGFWMIEQGTVSVCRFGEHGSLTVFGLLGAGDLFGELAHFAGLPRQVDAVALGDATLVRIGAALIDRLLEDQPDFARWLLKSLAHQLRVALDRIDRDHNLPAHARLSRALADMVRREGPELDLTQQALADLIGISRVTAGQILADLEKAGTIRRGYRRIVVINPAALAAAAG